MSIYISNSENLCLTGHYLCITKYLSVFEFNRSLRGLFEVSYWGNASRLNFLDVLDGSHLLGWLVLKYTK